MDQEPTSREEPQSYSIALRLRRTTQEYAFFRVPVTSEIVDEQPDGSGKINFEKMTQVALKMGELDGVYWYVEGRDIEVHPIQKPIESEEEYSNKPFRLPGEE